MKDVVVGSSSDFALSNLTKGKTPRLPFLLLKRRVLGKRYALSLVFAGDAVTQKLNRTYRKKTYVPNVLSFPLDTTFGEIFLNLTQAKREHRARGESLDFYIALLFVHALYHLKGVHHGSRMEMLEKRALRAASIDNTLGA